MRVEGVGLEVLGRALALGAAGSLLLLGSDAEGLEAAAVKAEEGGGLLEGRGGEGGGILENASGGEEAAHDRLGDQGELVPGLSQVGGAGAGDLQDPEVGEGLLRILLGEGRGVGVRPVRPKGGRGRELAGDALGVGGAGARSEALARVRRSDEVLAVPSRGRRGALVEALAVRGRRGAVRRV